MCTCKRTIDARVRRHADKEHKKQDPKSARQTRLHIKLVHCLGSRMWVTVPHNFVPDVISAWTADLRVQPLNSDLRIKRQS